jgi:hypothetical protein
VVGGEIKTETQSKVLCRGGLNSGRIHGSLRWIPCHFGVNCVDPFWVSCRADDLFVRSRSGLVHCQFIRTKRGNGDSRSRSGREHSTAIDSLLSRKLRKAVFIDNTLFHALPKSKRPSKWQKWNVEIGRVRGRGGAGSERMCLSHDTPRGCGPHFVQNDAHCMEMLFAG